MFTFVAHVLDSLALWWWRRRRFLIAIPYRRRSRYMARIGKRVIELE